MKDDMLIENSLFKVGNNDYYWLHSCHHFITDGISFFLLGEQITNIYNTLIEGKEVLCEQNSSYYEYILDEQTYLLSDRFIKDKEFWNNKFSCLPLPAIQRKRKLGSIKTSKQMIWYLEKSLHEKILKYTSDRKFAYSTFMLSILVSHFILVKELDEVVIGVISHNRTHVNYKKMIGTFATIVPIKVSIKQKAMFDELMRAVEKELRSVFRHQRYPITEINRKLNIERKEKKQIFDIVFSFESFYRKLSMGGAEAYGRRLHNEYETMPLSINMFENGLEGITIEMNYNMDYLNDSEVEQIRDSMSSLIFGVIN
jgi:hypothetical protein